MKFEHYIKKLKDSKAYKGFSKQYPSAYLCAAFFVIDYKDGKHNETGIDFYNADDRKIITFKFDKEIQAVPLDALNEHLVPEVLPNKVRADVEQLSGILMDEMHNRTITNDIQKLIVILQRIHGKTIWNCTAFLSGMGLLKAHIDDESESVLMMDKSSLFDFLKPLSSLPLETLAQDAKDRKKKAGKNGKTPKAKVLTAKDLEKLMKGVKKPVDKEKAEGNQEGFIG